MSRALLWRNTSEVPKWQQRAWSPKSSISAPHTLPSWLRAGQVEPGLNRGIPNRNLRAVRNLSECSARPRPGIGGASSQSLAWGIEQASIRLLLRALDLAISTLENGLVSPRGELLLHALLSLQIDKVVWDARNGFVFGQKLSHARGIVMLPFQQSSH